MRVSPFTILFFLLLSVPLLEIYLLVSLGRVIGAGTTILVVIVTAVLGAWLLRMQGLSTLARVQAMSQAGKIPALELVEGVILLASAILLLTPGFFTDAIGFLSLVPSIRRFAARAILARALSRRNPDLQSRGAAGATIEGSYRREDPP